MGGGRRHLEEGGKRGPPCARTEAWETARYGTQYKGGRAKYYNSVELPQMMDCPNCDTPKVMHRACPQCGHYRGRQVVEPEDDLMY